MPGAECLLKLLSVVSLANAAHTRLVTAMVR